MKISIQKQDFDINKEILTIKANSNIGAVVSFVGFVRDIVDNNLQKMVLETYESMGIKVLEDIANKAKNKWDIDDITIIHRVGELLINEKIVLVLVASKHRSDGFHACEFIMDYLKTDAPFWKKEYKNNDANWVKANHKDVLHRKKWS